SRADQAAHADGRRRSGRGVLDGPLREGLPLPAQAGGADGPRTVGPLPARLSGPVPVPVDRDGRLPAVPRRAASRGLGAGRRAALDRRSRATAGRTAAPVTKAGGAARAGAADRPGRAAGREYRGPHAAHRAARLLAVAAGAAGGGLRPARRAAGPFAPPQPRATAHVRAGPAARGRGGGARGGPPGAARDGP